MDKIQCEVPKYNTDNTEIKEILDKYKTVAIVGLSDKETRDSYKVAKYLKENGYKIIPVNPNKDEILGEKAYKDIKSIPFDIDIVDIFRKPDAIPEIVDMAIEKKARVIWMQLGLTNNEAAQKALDAGLKVVQNKCMKVEHQRYFQNENTVSVNLNL